MLRYSPCLDIFFKDMPFEERIEETSRIGYSFFEFWTWWDKDLEKIRASMYSHSIQCRALCTRFVSLTRKDERPAYLKGLEESLEAARRLNAPIVISQVGDEIIGMDRASQRASIIDGLKAAAELLENAGQDPGHRASERPLRP